MALWMEGGCVVSSGSRRSSAASTAMRSSSKNAGSFIAAEVGWAMRVAPRSRLVLFFGLEGLGDEFAIGFLQQDFHAPFRFFQLFLALAGKGHAFLKQFHGFVECELWAFQAAHYFLEARQGLLKVGLFHRLRFFSGG